VRKAFREEIHKEARALLHSGQVANWTEAVARADDEFTCAARAKSTGKRCEARPEPGRKHCRLHGGIVKPHTPEFIAMQRVRAAKQPRERGRWAKRESPE
jgi:hypothetical protein